MNDTREHKYSPLDADSTSRASLARLGGVADGAPFGLSRRCHERGCVFPAALGGICPYHYRQAHEPECFHSQQPSAALLERAKFGIPDAQDASRMRDRRLLAAMRQEFLDGG